MRPINTSLIMDLAFCSIFTFRKIKKDLDLIGTRGQAHTVESIDAAISRIRRHFPDIGFRDLKRHLNLDKAMKVPM